MDGRDPVDILIDQLLQLENRFLDIDVMSAWSQAVESSIQKNFLVGGRFSVVGSILGGPLHWTPLADATVRERDRLGYDPTGNILRRTNHLFNSIGVRPRPGGIILNAGTVYAAAQNFGVNHLPGRPFLVVQEEDFQEFIRICSLI